MPNLGAALLAAAGVDHGAGSARRLPAALHRTLDRGTRRAQLLRVGEWFLGRAVVVAVAGEVDTLTESRLWDTLDGAMRRADTRRVVVDLLEVTLLASAGLTVLAWAAVQCQRTDRQLRIVADHRAVLRPLRITNLDAQLTVCPTLGAALRN